MSQSERERQMQDQYEKQLHQGNLQIGGENSNAPETLKYVTKPEDIDSPIETIDWFNSRSASTTNLEDEDIRSKEWIIEYHRRMSLLQHPPDYGVTGHLRAYVYDDADEYKLPMNESSKMQVEGFSEVGKESSMRSKEGWATNTATAIRKESVVRDENENSGRGGLLGRIRG